MHSRPTPPYGARFGVARVLSKQGVCSRSTAERWVREGRVRVNGRCVLDPEYPVRIGQDRVECDTPNADAAAAPLYLMLNKPRGLLTTAQDERGRDTVYRCFADAGLPWIAPVGRLDQASEGLLLFSNDPVWAARVLDPQTGPDKTYHVQIDAKVGLEQLAAMRAGVVLDQQRLAFKAVQVIREGSRGCWLEVVLDEGRNRQIRRVLKTLGFEVRRLLRVAIGALPLGELAKGQWRFLSEAECSALAAPGRAPPVS